MMLRDILSKITIPPDWTGEQAWAVVEFIDEISSAIWNVHDEKIVAAIQKDSQLEQAQDYDDLPF